MTGNTIRNIAHLHLYSIYTAVLCYYDILSFVHLNSLTLIKNSILFVGTHFNNNRKYFYSECKIKNDMRR